MSCLDNYITLEDIGTSKSGLYLDHIEGIDKELFEELAKEGQGYEDKFNQFYTHYKSMFISEITIHLGDKFFFDKILASELTGKFNFQSNTGTGKAGVKIDTLRSRYSITRLERVEFYINSLPSPAIVDLKVYDNENRLLETIQIEATEGYNSHILQKEYNQSYLYISLDKSLDLYKTEYFYNDKNNCRDCNNVNYKIINGGGLIVDYTTICSVEEYVCSKIKMFENAFINYLAMQTMSARVLSRNVNQSTNLTEERADQLAAVYDKEYKKAIKAVFKNLKITDDPLCAECKSIVQSSINIP